MNALLIQFLAEARELLESASAGLLVLEQNPADQDTVDAVFRAVHTLKGSSSLFEFVPLTQLLHAGEDVLDATRQGTLIVTPALIDTFFKSTDCVSAWIANIEADETLPENAQDEATELSRELRAALPASRSSDQKIAPRDADLANDREALAWCGALAETVRATARERSDAGAALLAITYTPDPQCFFSGEDPLHLMGQVPDLLALPIVEPAAWPPLAELDAYACVLRFHALTIAPRAAVQHLFRYVPEEITITEVPPSTFSTALSDRAGEAKSGNGSATDTSSPDDVVFSRVVQEQAHILGLPCAAEQRPSRLAAVAQTLRNMLTYLQLTEQLQLLDAAQLRAQAEESFAPLQAFLEPWLAATPAPEDGDESGPAGRSRKAPPELEPDGEQRRMVGVLGAVVDQIVSKTFKVDQERIDLLMNLIGELVVAKNSLPYVARRAEEKYGVRELAREITDQYAVLHRITKELHGAIMGVRMLPVSSVFQRFPRLVRDLSRKLQKQINLVVQGEETEADKNMIERLADPLIHIVRNSIDHGIEKPAERQAAGKPAQGTIRLSAFQEGDRVVIDIHDDGKGIDPEVIKRKSYEKGLLDEARLATITDEEVLQLVFEPGFSTADQVTDVSGRGVGMDVVRRALAACDGSIKLESTKGVGTRLRLSVPLTMAVSRVLIISEGNESFGIPMDVVVETARVSPADIRLLKQAEVVPWREKLLPVYRLGRLLRQTDRSWTTQEESIALLIVRLGGEEIALQVGAFHGIEDIILKPLEGVLHQRREYAGTAVLGDGRILLILNLKEVV